MEKIVLKNFYNDGFGWNCRNCELEFDRVNDKSNDRHSRLMREGEAESKKPNFSNKSLAKWTNETKNTLICPRCGITELVEKR